MTERFKDTAISLHQFTDNILVHCPRCNSLAYVSRLGSKPYYFSGPTSARVVCTKCGYSKEQVVKVIRLGGPIDSYFSLPLWLQRPCCGEILWAYNREHLNYLESFVQAKLRKTGVEFVYARGVGKKTMSLAAKLPPWLKSAKNRDEILGCIEKLKQTLE